MTTALRIVAVRYQCPHCSRTRAKRTTTEAHIARCWHNPDVRSCKTCRFFEPASGSLGGCIPGQNCSCNVVDEGCLHADVPAGWTFPAVHCPLWQPSTD